MQYRQNNIFTTKLSCYISKTPNNKEGDKIILHESILEMLIKRLYKLPLPTIFEIRNVKNKKIIHCGVLEFSSSKNVALLPPWMVEYLSLEEGDEIRLTLKKLQKLTYVQFRPKTQNFSQLSDTKAILENALLKFTTLTLNSSIKICHEFNYYEFEVTKIEPSVGRNPAGCIIDTMISVDFLEPKESQNTNSPESQDIFLNKKLNGFTKKDCYEYYKLNIQNQNISLKITLICLRGDANLYISTKTAFPNHQNNLWENLKSGKEKIITINSSNLNYSKTYYYLSVLGYNSDVEFSLLISEIKEEKSNSHKGNSLTSNLSQSENTKKCINCLKYIPKQNYDIHIISCSRLNFLCKKCSEVVLISKKDLHNHCPKCDQILEKNQMSKHLDIDHSIIKCKCDEEMENRFFLAHKSSDCIFRKVRCNFCELLVTYVNLEKHVSYCGTKTVKCEKCSKRIQENKLINHMAAFHNLNPCIERYEYDIDKDQMKMKENKIENTLKEESEKLSKLDLNSVDEIFSDIKYEDETDDDFVYD